MTELLKRLKGTAVPVAVYYKSTGGFCAGFVREADGEFVLMEFISPSGRFDGYHCIRIEEILKIDAGSNYLKNLVKVYRHYGETPPPIKVSSQKVLESFIDFLAKSKKLCSMEIGFETLEKLGGYISGRDWDTVEIQLLDENGLPDGYTALDLEEIVYIGTDSEAEKYLELLEKLNGESPEPPTEKDGTVVSFPFKK